VFGGFPSTAWFDVGELSEDAADDIEGLDAAATHVANLLSNEPSDIKVGVGGFSMGAAASLYSATCFARGKFGNSNNYPTNLSAVVGLSGWLPCSKTLQIGGNENASRAATLPILLCHGKGDDVVPHKWGEKSSRKLSENGFQDVGFKSYSGLGHYTIPEEMEEVCSWLTSKLGLGGSSSQ
jgi:lysophospholipase-2